MSDFMEPREKDSEKMQQAFEEKIRESEQRFQAFMDHGSKAKVLANMRHVLGDLQQQLGQ